ncbi:hypothetical protein JQ557_34865, partial [Bradyrhizobium sp. U87765 SZCCT0131]|uniref:hypothetical protein n=1 Tax=unclassified Bradyrhizobium TaxID=2631580 RepID=UPI001BABE312
MGGAQNVAAIGVHYFRVCFQTLGRSAQFELLDVTIAGFRNLEWFQQIWKFDVFFKELAVPFDRTTPSWCCCRVTAFLMESLYHPAIQARRLSVRGDVVENYVMKKILLGTVALIALGSSAFAADLP